MISIGAPAYIREREDVEILDEANRLYSALHSHHGFSFVKHSLMSASNKPLVYPWDAQGVFVYELTDKGHEFIRDLGLEGFVEKHWRFIIEDAENITMGGYEKLEEYSRLVGFHLPLQKAVNKAREENYNLSFPEIHGILLTYLISRIENERERYRVVRPQT